MASRSKAAGSNAISVITAGDRPPVSDPSSRIQRWASLSLPAALAASMRPWIVELTRSITGLTGISDLPCCFVVECNVYRNNSQLTDLWRTQNKGRWPKMTHRPEWEKQSQRSIGDRVAGRHG